MKRMGDGWLVEFTSVVNAVGCAIKIQEALDCHETIKLRMGIHIGDITHENEDIFGDGVNIAARLQEKADPGGIAISASIHDSLDGVARIKFSSLGLIKLKNIAKKVEIFSWRTTMPGIIDAGPENERPTIMVLPFAVRDGSIENELLAEGLADAITIALSRFSWFNTLPRNSSIQYKNKLLNVAQLRQEQGAAYVLEGSIRKYGSRVRIRAELLDTKTNSSFWSDRFEGDAEDPFELEDKITRSILAELTPRLLGAEARRVKHGGDGSAWDLMMQGRGFLWRVNEKDVARAKQLFVQAAALEPESGIAQSDLSWACFFQRLYGWGRDFDKISANANEAAELALVADDLDAYAFAAASAARCLVDDSTQAIAFARRAIRLNYNLAAGHGILSLALFQAGEYEQAADAAKVARELSPRDPLRSILMAIRGVIYFLLNQYQDMLCNAEELIREFPDMPTGWRQLAVAYVKLGRGVEAKHIIDTQVLRLIPGHTATDSGRQIPFGVNATARQRWVEALVKAGLSA